MKLKCDYVTNSSSSSFIFVDNRKEKSNKVKVTIEFDCTELTEDYLEGDIEHSHWHDDNRELIRDLILHGKRVLYGHVSTSVNVCFRNEGKVEDNVEIVGDDGD